jgi:hypothetical protein
MAAPIPRQTRYLSQNNRREVDDAPKRVTDSRKEEQLKRLVHQHWDGDTQCG